jgi:protein disulfide-isomerase A6
MTTDQAAGSGYDIKGYPTLKFFGANKASPLDYSGGRDAQAIVNYALDQAKQVVNSRMNKGSSGGNNANSGSQKSSGGNSGSNSSGDETAVTLNAGNFESLVFGSKNVWFIELYAPWCGHCKVQTLD